MKSQKKLLTSAISLGTTPGCNASNVSLNEGIVTGTCFSDIYRACGIFEPEEASKASFRLSSP